MIINHIGSFIFFISIIRPMKSSYIQERRSLPILVHKEPVLCPSPKSIECSIKNNLFDPNINSPPSDWMIKLQSRINTYYTESKICNSEKK